MEVPITLSNEREKRNEEKLTNLVVTASEKPPETKHGIKSDQEILAAEQTQLELLILCHSMVHLAFIKIKILDLLGIIPKRLANTNPPKCEGHIYGAMSKRPWRTKGRHANTIQTVTKPGQCLLVDQLESPLLGFLDKLKGRPTKQQYRSATVSFDHFSLLIYLHLHINLTPEDTLKEKQDFEAYSQKQGVTIRHYHVNNGRFSENTFIKSIKTQGKTISYCVVNAHTQIVKSEKRIRYLQ